MIARTSWSATCATRYRKHRAVRSAGVDTWKRIEPNPPTDVRGVQRADDRRVISGILHVLKSGCRWCDCRPECGRTNCKCKPSPWCVRTGLTRRRLTCGAQNDHPSGALPTMNNFRESRSSHSRTARSKVRAKFPKDFHPIVKIPTKRSFENLRAS